MKKFFTTIFFLILVLNAFHAFAIKPEEINQQIELNRKKIMETPMKITYTIVREEITYPKPITETHVGEGGWKSTSSRSPSPEVDPLTGEKKPLEMLTNLETNERAVAVICGKKSRLDKFHPGEKEPYTIYSRDEKEARNLVEGKSLKDNKPYKMGYIYEDPYLLRIFQYFPAQGWWYGKFKDTDEITILEDGTIQIRKDSSDKKRDIFSISPAENYLLKSHKIFFSGHTLNVHEVTKTVNVGDMILPREIEIRRYKEDGETIDQHFHYTDIEYEILSEQEALSLCKLEFPEKTHVINMGNGQTSKKRLKSQNPSSGNDMKGNTSPSQP
jgi:hypothetical protein